MKIGITERGDAAIDFSWVDKLSKVDGAIIITKNLTDKFIETFLEQSKVHNLILHCTCTGWGSSIFEPNVPKARTQIDQLKKLIDLGFDPNKVVFRVDPIIPTEAGLHRVRDVLTYFLSLDLGISRIRVSVYDEYKHVKERLIENGFTPCYDEFYANQQQLESIVETLNKFPLKYELCAENELYKLNPEIFEICGCVSLKELRLFNLEPDSNMLENMQNRHGCHCLAYKTELLSNKCQCPHKCMYCYWK